MPLSFQQLTKKHLKLFTEIYLLRLHYTVPQIWSISSVIVIYRGVHY
jgi:hypothetical protein